MDRNEIERSLFSDALSKDVMLNWQMSILKGRERWDHFIILHTCTFLKASNLFLLLTDPWLRQSKWRPRRRRHLCRFSCSIHNESLIFLCLTNRHDLSLKWISSVLELFFNWEKYSLALYWMNFNFQRKKNFYWMLRFSLINNHQ